LEDTISASSGNTHSSQSRPESNSRQSHGACKFRVGEMRDVVLQVELTETERQVITRCNDSFFTLQNFQVTDQQFHHVGFQTGNRRHQINRSSFLNQLQYGILL
jgi:hypothetical protein